MGRPELGRSPSVHAAAPRGRPSGCPATGRGRPVEVPLELDQAFAAFQRLAVEPLSPRGDSSASLGPACVEPDAAGTRYACTRSPGATPFSHSSSGARLARGAVGRAARMSRFPRALSALVTERFARTSGACPQHARCCRCPRSPFGDAARAARRLPVDDIELAEKQGIARARRRPDPLHPSTTRSRELCSDAAAQEASAPPPARRARRRSRRTRPPSRDRRHRAGRGK